MATSPAWSATASATPSSSACGSSDLTSDAPRAGFRPDVEGLRAVAVLLVMAYHAGLPLRNGFLGLTSGGQLVAGQAAGPAGGTGGGTGADSLRDGLAQRWRELVRVGSDVAVLADTPAAPDDLDVCTARHPTDLAACDFALDARSQGAAVDVQRDAARPAEVSFLDLTETICPARTCPVVVDHVAIHRPDGYLAASFVRTLAPQLGAQLDVAGR